MTIARKTFVHEILIRLDEKGFVAAHVQDLECMTENGVILPGTAKEGLPRSVTEAEVGALIGSDAARIVESASRSAAYAQEQKERADAVEGELADLKVSSSKSEAELADRKNGLIRQLWSALAEWKEDTAKAAEAAKLGELVERELQD